MNDGGKAAPLINSGGTEHYMRGWTGRMYFGRLKAIIAFRLILLSYVWYIKSYSEET